MCHQQFDPLDSLGPSAPGFESCGWESKMVQKPFHTSYIYKLTQCLPSRMQHIGIVVLPTRILRLWTLEHGNLWNMLMRVENIATKLALLGEIRDGSPSGIQQTTVLGVLVVDPPVI